MFDKLNDLSPKNLVSLFNCDKAIRYLHETGFKNLDILKVIEDNVQDIGEDIFVLADANFSKDTVRYLSEFMSFNEAGSTKDYWKEININVAADLRNRGKLSAEQYDYILAVLDLDENNKEAFDKLVDLGIYLGFSYSDTKVFAENFSNNAFMPYLVIYPKVDYDSKKVIMNQPNQFLAQYLFRWYSAGYRGRCLELFATAWDLDIPTSAITIEDSSKMLQANYDVMYELLEAAKNGIDMSKYKKDYRFNSSQLREIWSGKLQGLDVDKFAKESYPAWLMYTIRLGLIQGVDISESATQINSVKEGQDLIYELLHR